MSDEPATQPAIYKRHRLPLVWIVPVIALLVAGWLGYGALADRGPMITITLQSAEGLEAKKTKILHRNIELGIVERITPNQGLTSVTVAARMTRFAETYLTEATRFWVVRPRLSAEGISGLATLFSGSYIEMEPAVGASARHFVALEEPPVISTDVAGTRYVLHSRRLDSVMQGAPVTFRGIRVGEVLGYQLSDEDGNATVQIFVRAPHDKLVHEGSRFWNASGIAVDVSSEGIKLQSESLQAILVGGVAFDVPPGGEPGRVAPPVSAFTLYNNAEQASDALFTRKIRFLIHLSGNVQGLAPGAAVRLRGIKVGEVADVHMEFDATNGQLTIPVILELEPQRVTILNSDSSEEGFEKRGYAVFDDFVSRGLRAKLGSGNLLTGQKIISLDFEPKAPNAKMATGGLYPEIPAIESTDFQSILVSAQGLLVSLQATAVELNKLMVSPEMARSLRSLDRSLANVDVITHDVSLQIGPFLAGLREVSDSADRTLKEATNTLAVTKEALDSGGEMGGDLAGTLNELKQAARSLHALTDYLEHHPESLVQGKSAGAKP